MNAHNTKDTAPSRIATDLAIAASADTRIALDRYASYGEAVKARRLVRIALAKGYAISVYDGEEWTVKQSTDRMTVLQALATTECDTLRFRKDGEKLGSMLLIYGNATDGSELIADYSANEAMETLYNEVAR